MDRPDWAIALNKVLMQTAWSGRSMAV